MRKRDLQKERHEVVAAKRLSLLPEPRLEDSEPEADDVFYGDSPESDDAHEPIPQPEPGRIQIGPLDI